MLIPRASRTNPMTLRICPLVLLLSNTASRPTTTEEQDTLQGKVVRIADGDAFSMFLDKETTIKV